MRIFLLFLSSFISVFAYSQAETRDSLEMQTSAFQDIKCAVSIDTGKASVTGILITKENDEFILGSIINEFGISAMDFSYNKSKDKLKLEHVVSFLNKWYIKRVLSNDIKFCLHILYDMPLKKMHNYQINKAVDLTRIINTKRKISYTFSPITQLEQDETSE